MPPSFTGNPLFRGFRKVVAPQYHPGPRSRCKRLPQQTLMGNCEADSYSAGCRFESYGGAFGTEADRSCQNSSILKGNVRSFASANQSNRSTSEDDRARTFTSA